MHKCIPRHDDAKLLADGDWLGEADGYDDAVVKYFKQHDDPKAVRELHVRNTYNRLCKRIYS